ncbi:hypothetical protein HanXRQr2_Chr08g0354951 [Helianthus annuus]|uniref:Uncharacterized protein n=1 Tax=Helianthus annuus TaxID=4232 RepID=A0A9K3IGZ4_HELAN|nr:hypothetical protein HanXRQr2_Chr08g0354951 [Helianthus annuus]KAJ0902898.1 hypothetical protein HanPSC8_Chr08g0342691 [Helianthus annuus]
MVSLCSVSFTSDSQAPGGTSTAGEQLKNPCGCNHIELKKISKLVTSFFDKTIIKRVIVCDCHLTILPL